jgi:RNA polymerase sigma factor (sigma-70 family)
MSDKKVDELVSHLFRKEAGRMAAVLTRAFSFENFDTAEDIVQETLLKAVTVWKFKGIPDNPSAWLYSVAKRRAIDILRQNKVRHDIETNISASLKSEWTLSASMNELFLEHEIEDSQLRMFFACCHPSIPYESQIALTLKTLCGLSISEIARAFLTKEETIIKRLYRAREKIRTEKISLEVPSGAALSIRMDAVLHTLYLLFNEGYNSSHPGTLIRRELCEDAIRLCFLLTKNSVTNNATANALLALMCIHASREPARLNPDGEIVLMKDQNRILWDHDLIRHGLHFLNIASESDAASEYHIEAAIAACHATAPNFESTDWKQIYSLYDALSRIKPGPIVEMNKAIALGYGTSVADGLQALLEIQGLDSNYLYHSALGDFYTLLRNNQEAGRCYDAALKHVSSNTERLLIVRKKFEMGNRE